MTKADLKRYLVEEAEYSQTKVDQMDAWDMIDAWLEYNGIIGYTHELLMVIEASEYFGKIKIHQ